MSDSSSIKSFSSTVTSLTDNQRLQYTPSRIKTILLLCLTERCQQVFQRLQPDSQKPSLELFNTFKSTARQVFQEFYKKYTTLRASQIMQHALACGHFLKQNNWWIEQIWNEVLLNNIENEQIRTVSTTTFSQEYQDLKCPITTELIKDPVCLKQCGHEFQRLAIIQHIKKYHNCPLCQSDIFVSENDIRPAFSLKKQLDRFIKRAKRKGKCWVEQRIAINYEKEIQGR